MTRLMELVFVRSLFFLIWTARAVAQPDEVVAYEVPSGTIGNQDYPGTLGMDFDVLLDIGCVQRLRQIRSSDNGLHGLTGAV